MFDEKDFLRDVSEGFIIVELTKELTIKEHACTPAKNFIVKIKSRDFLARLD